MLVLYYYRTFYFGERKFSIWMDDTIIDIICLLFYHFRCWSNGESRYRYVYIIPVFLSIVLNLVFLCNILRVLMLKLKAPAGLQAGAPPRTMVQAFRYENLFIHFHMNYNVQHNVFLSKMKYIGQHFSWCHYLVYNILWHHFVQNWAIHWNELMKQYQRLQYASR